MFIIAVLFFKSWKACQFISSELYGIKFPYVSLGSILFCIAYLRVFYFFHIYNIFISMHSVLLTMTVTLIDT